MYDSISAQSESVDIELRDSLPFPSLFHFAVYFLYHTIPSLQYNAILMPLIVSSYVNNLASLP